MVREIIHRPVRKGPPAPAARAHALAGAPSQPTGTVGGILQAVIPALGGLGMVMFLVANGNPVFLLAGMVMLAGTVGGGIGLFVFSRTGARRQFRQAREAYLEYVEQVREDLRTIAAQFRDHNAHVHTEPQRLATWVGSARVYERRPTHADFGLVRVGAGAVPHPVRVQAPAPRSPLERLDAVSLRAASGLAASQRTVAAQPLCVPCGTASSIVVTGPERAAALATVRALCMQLMAAHSPEDLRIAVCSPTAADDFAWVRWAPHAQDPHLLDGVTPRAWLTAHREELQDELHDYLQDQLEELGRMRRIGAAYVPTGRLVVVLDEWTTGPGGPLTPANSSVNARDLGVCVVRMVSRPEAEPAEVDVRITREGHRIRLEGPALAAALDGRADEPTDADATALARALAPLQVAADLEVEEPLVADTSIESLLDLDDIGAWTPDLGWRPRSRADLLRVPIGVRADGQPLLVDLKESAYDGMGPHGLVVGATGSGKSELLRSLVLGLAATHPPQTLAFVLVDFKGGATFAGLESLPHVSAAITNLAGDLSLVDRLRDALFGEIARRQEVLHRAGNLPNVYAYEALRRDRPDLDPLPTLLVVVDEFAELLTAKPDFIGLFTAIGRIGRSIGVHQLLASQRLDDGQLRGLESFLSYRLALRTFNAEESRSVIGVPDAFQLPPIPGSGFLKVDTTVFERFKAAYVSGPYRRSASLAVEADLTVQRLRPLNSTPRRRELTVTPRATPEGQETAPGTSVLDVAVARIRGHGEAVHRIWLPPLPRQLSLSDVEQQFGMADEPLTPILGVVDLPEEQRQEPLAVPFGTSALHLAVLGGPQSGRSTTLRTIALALSRLHPPGDIALHAVDFGGGSLRGLSALPHVGTVAGRLDVAMARRVLSDLAIELDRREALFARRGFPNAAAMRRAFAAGEVPELSAADVFLLLDDYVTVKTDFDDLHDRLVALVTRGGAFGVHVVLTAPRWHDLRPVLQTAIPARIELRLNDPMDSVFDRRTAAGLPDDVPGRGLDGVKRVAQLALPILAPARSAQAPLAVAEVDALEEVALRTVAGQHSRRRVAPIRMLPSSVALDELAGRPGAQVAPDPATHKALRPVLLGMAEDDLGPVLLDLTGADTHLMIFGDQSSGKTEALRLIADQLVAHHDDSEVVITVVDPRRTLIGAVPDDYLGAYAPNPQSAEGLSRSLATELQRRLPTTTDPSELSQHRWLGPQIVVLVDDAELVTGPQGNALMPLLPYLPAGRDIGLHVVVARHAGGAARSLFEPFNQRLKELGSPAVLLSGDPEEGALWPKATMSAQPPGRGLLVRRSSRPRLVQLARR